MDKYHAKYDIETPALTGAIRVPDPPEARTGDLPIGFGVFKGRS